MSEWISVKERLPEMKETYKGSPLTSGRVLIVLNAGQSVDTGEYSETYVKRTRRWESTIWGANVRVSYWMPMPEPPK